VTARRVPELLPVLDDFGQDVSVDVDESGRATRTLHHMLKMFLIDAHGEVREIYTLAFLQPPVMFNDIKTLALEAAEVNRLDFKLEATASGSRARAARLRTRHNEVLTPTFMPVGTHAAVRSQRREDLLESGAQILLGEYLSSAAAARA